MEKLINGIPYPVITPIIVVLTYESMKLVNNEITGNAVTAPTNLACGNFVYTCITLTPSVYTNISIDAWVPPPNPSIQAIIPFNSTGS